MNIGTEVTEVTFEPVETDTPAPVEAPAPVETPVEEPVGV